jgi:hypothetical protein
MPSWNDSSMRITKNVFLDTSAIIAQNFNFSSPALAAIEKLAHDGEANLLTTSIVIREVEANIKERIKNAEVGIGRIKTSHSILKNITQPSARAILSPFDAEKATSELISRYLEYRKRTKTHTIPLESASASDVFDAYFSGQPPFDDEKKKSEFPDAFNIYALESWCKSTNEKVYVVATDPDIARHCRQSERLILLPRAGEYADLFNRESATMRLVEESTQENLDPLREAITKTFEESGFYLDDLEGDVNEVKVEEVEIGDLSLLTVDGGVAQFEVSGNINFSADISYDDPETGIWDSEDKVTIGMERVNPEVDRTVEYTLTADVNIGEDGRFKSVRGIKFNDNDFGFSAIEDDYPYK